MSLIGIDLGTTYCSIAYKNDVTNTLDMIDNSQKGGKSIPSIIGFDDDEIQYNWDAVNTKKNNPKNTLYDSKRYLGRKFDNIEENFTLDKNNYKLNNINNKPFYEIDFKNKKFNLPPEIISGLILDYLKRTTIKILEIIDGCVITVPAHFTNIEREATLLAAELAGLNVLQLLNEPSAAAISYGFEKGKTGRVLVFDYGGGTLDISIVQIKENKFDVIGYGGDQILGGRDIDNKLLEYCINQFKELYNIDHDTPKKRAILLEKCEQAKIFLSETTKLKTKIFDWNECENIILEKEMFNKICKPFFEKSIETIGKVLDKIKINKNDIDEIIMTGGTSKLPLIQEMIFNYFGKTPHTHDPEGAIAKGAAIVAFKLKNSLNLDLLDQIRYPIGTNVINRIETNGRELISIIVPAGTKIPTKCRKGYRTVKDNQTSIRIAIAEGESDYFDGNTFIDEFSINFIPPKPKGEFKFDVTIDINKSGILSVFADGTTDKVSSSKVMSRKGNYYKDNEREEIKTLYSLLLEN